MIKGITLDEALSPMKMTCGNCGAELIVYPCPIPEGTTYCPNCSPEWLKHLAEYLMNEERTKRGLAPLKIKKGNSK